MSAIDPVTLGVVQAGLQQVCNEMDLAFVRSAFSPVISEGLDRSDGIYAKDDGKLIAQGELGLPVFVGTMQFSTEHLIATQPVMREGDIFAVNDPYLGGTHLMDVRFAMPYFYRGEHVAWLSNTGHWPDTGGMVPGGFSARATEVVQEGLRFPPIKLYKEGVIDEEILSIPGIGKKMLHEFKEYRPYKDIKQFRREIGKYVDEDEDATPIFRPNLEVVEAQLERLARVRAERDQGAVDAALGRLREAARGDENLMEPIMEAVRTYATLGEMCGVLREEWGEYVPPTVV